MGYNRGGKIFVVDVESTCWEKEPPKGQKSEIIQIGITVVNSKEIKIEESMSFFTRPIFSKVSEYCTELTGITPEQVAKAPLFSDVCHKLQNMGLKHYTWASYGDYDRTMFYKNCDYYEDGCDLYPFGLRHWNIKDLIGHTANWSKNRGVLESLDFIGENFEGRHHDGQDDSKNIAKVLVYLLKKMKGL